MLPHEHHPQEEIAKFGYESYRNCFLKRIFFWQTCWNLAMVVYSESPQCNLPYLFYIWGWWGGFEFKQE